MGIRPIIRDLVLHVSLRDVALRLQGWFSGNDAVNHLAVLDPTMTRAECRESPRYVIDSRYAAKLLATRVQIDDLPHIQAISGVGKRSANPVFKDIVFVFEFMVSILRSSSSSSSSRADHAVALTEKLSNGSMKEWEMKGKRVVTFSSLHSVCADKEDVAGEVDITTSVWYVPMSTTTSGGFDFVLLSIEGDNNRMLRFFQVTATAAPLSMRLDLCQKFVAR